MDISQAQDFVRANPRGVLITYKRDGSAQSSPVLAAIDGSGALVVSSREPAYKVRNLRRDPRVAYCGLTERFFGSWLQIDGTAEIISLPDAMEGLVDYYRALSGEHSDWADYRAAMEKERRVLISVRIERAGPTVSG